MESMNDDGGSGGGVDGGNGDGGGRDDGGGYGEGGLVNEECG